MENKAEARESMRRMKEVVTSTGFTCRADPEKLDDWDLVNLSLAARRGDKEAALEVVQFIVDRVLSAEDAGRLKQHVRTEDGRTPASRISEECTEIMTGLRSKNAESSAG